MDESNKKITLNLTDNGLPVSLKLYEPQKTLIFNTGNNEWVMKIEDGKISFNRARWPDCEPNEFAKAVISILESCTVDMENLKRQVPFDENKDVK